MKRESSSDQAQDTSIEVFRDSIFKNFSEVPDPRLRSKRIEHKLSNIFLITIYAVLCGANTLKDVATYAKERKSWLEEFLELPFGVPCYTTFWTVYSMLDPQKFHQWMSVDIRCWVSRR